LLYLKAAVTDMVVVQNFDIMSADWIELVQDRAQWWTFVNMIISFQIP
jgi:hypothetical protein